MTELNEPILKDDYPVYGSYSYVADGKVVICPLGRATVAGLKKALGAEEIRRCDIVARGVAPRKPKRVKKKHPTSMGEAFKKLGLL